MIALSVDREHGNNDTRTTMTRKNTRGKPKSKCVYEFEVEWMHHRSDIIIINNSMACIGTGGVGVALWRLSSIHHRSIILAFIRPTVYFPCITIILNAKKNQQQRQQFSTHTVTVTTTRSRSTTSTTTKIGNTSDTANNMATSSDDQEKRILRVAVGTKNPCKVNAVQLAVERAIRFSEASDLELHVEGFAVESGVADQPFGDVSLLRN
jgi:hypothetical protein